MALNFPDVGENVALEAIVNKTAPQNLVLRLYQNNITPSDTDVAGTYTESTFAGYASLTLAGATWGAAAAGTITYGAQQTFTRTVTGAAENCYGYYVTQLASGILVYSERDAGAPFIIVNAGDAVKITPTISAN
jgi:hypothetical protein